MLHEIHDWRTVWSPRLVVVLYWEVHVSQSPQLTKLQPRRVNNSIKYLVMVSLPLHRNACSLATAQVEGSQQFGAQ
eukprot:m.104389 g.104389  ORF g.104389 m.104389 type:complete len:76 (-) comp13259_c0_seq4:108-335(-)